MAPEYRVRFQDSSSMPDRDVMSAVRLELRALIKDAETPSSRSSPFSGVYEYDDTRENNHWGCIPCNHYFRGPRHLLQHFEAIFHHPDPVTSPCGEVFRQRKALRSHIYGLGSKGKPRKGGPCLKSQCAEYRVNKPRKSGASFAKRRDFSDSTFSDSHTADAAHVEPLASSSHASARTTGVDKTLQDDENIRKDTLSPLIPPFDVQVENLTTSSPETTQGHSPTPALSPATPMAYYDPVFWGMDPHMGLTAEANSNSNALLPQPALHSILSLPLHSNQPTAAPLIPEMGDSMYPIYLFDPLSCDGNAFSNLKPPDKRRH